MHPTTFFFCDIVNIFFKYFGFNCLQLMHYVHVYHTVWIKSYEYFFVMKFFDCVAQVNNDTNPIKRDVLCGVNDSREIPIMIIVFYSWTKMKMD